MQRIMMKHKNETPAARLNRKTGHVVIASLVRADKEKDFGRIISIFNGNEKQRPVGNRYYPYKLLLLMSTS